MLKAKHVDRLMTGLMIGSAMIMAGILIFLLGIILLRGASHISLSFLTSNSSSFQAGGGIKNQLWNSFYLLVLTMVFTLLSMQKTISGRRSCDHVWNCWHRFLPLSSACSVCCFSSMCLDGDFPYYLVR